MPEKLRALIKSRGFTVQSFGDKLEMTREGVYDILKRKYLKPDLIQKICKVLTAQPEEFIDYKIPEDVKKKLHAQENYPDLQKENTELKKLLAEKQKIIDAQERIIIWQEHFFKKSRKSFAQATHPTKNKN